MLDLTWNVFCKTGNIDTYLLLKEIEKAQNSRDVLDEDEIATDDVMN
ncbi:YqzL family protein [Terrilactibacillus sp. BCM23-1]|uniref:YqzL family protein n=1 Tax=Terrilactibacillus tamarindi TaxID=2599694 RepID=A0A6N8CVF6_9BACI|nr:YqzL family protein [Terrilactibacillus tamarindi]MTT33273.1 YqzL family protein [Terrilactibacillus tamarindi]